MEIGMSRESTTNNIANDSRQAVIEALENGFDVIKRKPDELLVDLDDTTRDEFMDLLGRLARRCIRPQWVELWDSKSGNLHARVKLDESVTDYAAIAMQALLGSDFDREATALLDIRVSNPLYSILFRPDGAKVERLTEGWD